MGDYRFSLFPPEEDPLKKRARKPKLMDQELHLDPKIEAQIKAMQRSGQIPLEPTSKPSTGTPTPGKPLIPPGGWQFNPAGRDVPEAPAIDFNVPKQKTDTESKSPSPRDVAEKVGLPKKVVNLFVPPSDLAKPKFPEPIQSGNLGVTRLNEEAEQQMRKKFKQRTGKDPIELNVKFNIDERGRVWFSF